MADTKKRKPNSGSFKKGDPRINQNGQRNKAAVAFAKTLRELIVKEGEAKRAVKDENGNTVARKKIEWVVMSLYAQAIKGNMQAVAFIAERVEGKIKEELEHQGELVVRIEREGSQSSFANAARSAGQDKA